MHTRFIWLIAALFLTTCGNSNNCPTTAFSGTAWTPAVPSASSSNHNASISVVKTTQSTTGPIVGLGQAAPASKEISFTIDMTQDLGALGSLTLVAEVEDFPSSLSGGAYPMLVSLHDGTNEYINLKRAGSGGDCWASGYYTCSGGLCSANTNCSIVWPSAYFDRTHWEQRQAPNLEASGSPSTNIFPTCNWTGGSSASATEPACAFTDGGTAFFPGATARLRYGVNYTAKYVMISDSYSSVSSSTATLKLSTYKKTTPATAGASNGAVDFNVIIVGDTNITASRTAKGKQNLDTLIETVAGYYAQTNAGIALGTVNAVEWACSTGGNTYADLPVSQLGAMLTSGSALPPASSEGKAVNLFLVSTIVDDQDTTSSGFTILGFDGAIGAPPLNGTAVSGLTVATFDGLDTFNPNCSTSSATCSVSERDEDFQTLAGVLSHEIGHFYGLNHLSESGGSEHDTINDTPVCTATVTSGGNTLITLSSCLNSDTNVYTPTSKRCNQSCTSYSSASGVFCPTALECSFNYVMWWTTKNFNATTHTGDGNLFSANSGAMMKYNAMVQ